MKRTINYWPAIVLAFVGGGIGLQEFYVGRTMLGILAIIFCWTGIPTLVAYIEGLIWLFKGENYFNMKFNRNYFDKNKDKEKNNSNKSKLSLDNLL